MWKLDKAFHIYKEAFSKSLSLVQEKKNHILTYYTRISEKHLWVSDWSVKYEYSTYIYTCSTPGHELFIHLPRTFCQKALFEDNWDVFWSLAVPQRTNSVFTSITLASFMCQIKAFQVQACAEGKMWTKKVALLTPRLLSFALSSRMLLLVFFCLAHYYASFHENLVCYKAVFRVVT